MLADPDKGLRTAISQWETELEKKNNKKYTFSVYRANLNASRTPDGEDLNDYTIDEAIQKMTTSEKKALVLEAYLRWCMTYDRMNYDYLCESDINNSLKRLYNGTFRGVCSDGAKMGRYVAKAVGFNTNCVSSGEMNYEWCVVKVTNSSGKSYWKGIYTTSDAWSMKSNYPKNKDYNEFTKRDINK